MSDETMYQVLFQGGDGLEQLSDPESLDDARHTARELERKGYSVGAVMDVKSAREYMEYRYAPTYRGVKIPDDVRNDHTPRSVYEAWRRGVDSALDRATEDRPDNAGGDPFAPDLTMSPEVADFILRTVTGLLLEGYWQKGYDAEGRYGGTDFRDYDTDLTRRAANIVGSDRIKNADLLRLLAALGEGARKGGAS